MSQENTTPAGENGSESPEIIRRIAFLNDHFRRSLLEPAVLGSMASRSQVVLTHGLSTLVVSDVDVEMLVRAVAGHDFTAGVDEHGERDFGSFEFKGQQAFWKIDCYDIDLQWLSNDRADPEQTTRVLTLMLASEY